MMLRSGVAGQIDQPRRRMDARRRPDDQERVGLPARRRRARQSLERERLANQTTAGRIGALQRGHAAQFGGGERVDDRFEATVAVTAVAGERAVQVNDLVLRRTRSFQQIIDVLGDVDEVGAGREGVVGGVGLGPGRARPARGVPLKHELWVGGEALGGGKLRGVVSAPETASGRVAERGDAGFSAEPCAGEADDATGVRDDLPRELDFFRDRHLRRPAAFVRAIAPAPRARWEGAGAGSTIGSGQRRAGRIESVPRFADELIGETAFDLVAQRDRCLRVTVDEHFEHLDPGEQRVVEGRRRFEFAGLRRCPKSQRSKRGVPLGFAELLEHIRGAPGVPRFQQNDGQAGPRAPSARESWRNPAAR